MVSEIGGPDCEIDSTEGADDSDVNEINTLFAAHVSCVAGGTMAASGVKVNSVS